VGRNNIRNLERKFIDTLKLGNMPLVQDASFNWQDSTYGQPYFQFGLYEGLPESLKKRIERALPNGSCRVVGYLCEKLPVKANGIVIEQSGDIYRATLQFPKNEKFTETGKRVSLENWIVHLRGFRGSIV